MKEEPKYCEDYTALNHHWPSVTIPFLPLFLSHPSQKWRRKVLQILTKDRQEIWALLCPIHYCLFHDCVLLVPVLTFLTHLAQGTLKRLGTETTTAPTPIFYIHHNQQQRWLQFLMARSLVFKPLALEILYAVSLLWYSVCLLWSQ